MKASTLLPFATLACLALTGFSSNAHADAADRVEIVISAPATKIVGHYADLTPIEQVTLSARVPFNPAVLTLNSGVALLKDRVQEAARRICNETDFDAEDSDQDCVLRAVKSAQPQIDAAVARAKANEKLAAK